MTLFHEFKNEWSPFDLTFEHFDFFPDFIELDSYNPYSSEYKNKIFQEVISEESGASVKSMDG